MTLLCSLKVTHTGIWNRKKKNLYLWLTYRTCALRAGLDSGCTPPPPLKGWGQKVKRAAQFFQIYISLRQLGLEPFFDLAH